MNPRFFRSARAAMVAFALLTANSIAADKDDDDDKPPANANELPTLNAEQRKAVGIVVAHPVNATTPSRTMAFGLVLDPSTLVADAGDVESNAAASSAASAEVERLRGLLNAGAGASLKTLQVAQSEQVRAHAQLDTANARFASRWAAVASLPPSDRQKLIDAAAKGQSILVRAELSGRRATGQIPSKALIDVDGISVPAQVLGPLSQAGGDAQSAGVLIAASNAPSGIGPGTRMPITLVGAAVSGVLIPKEALLYEEGGAFVYKQTAKKSGDKDEHYAPIKVKLLQPQGDGWIVSGIDDDDDIVMHGAGVLWSLQGVSGKAADDDDDD
jgi:hypothetical protein